MAVIVVEDADRAPLAREDQLRKSISIKIAHDRAADQPNMLQCLGVIGIEHKLSGCAPINARAGRFGIVPGNNAATDEQIQSSVPVEIAQNNGPHAPVGLSN